MAFAFRFLSVCPTRSNYATFFPLILQRTRYSFIRDKVSQDIAGRSLASTISKLRRVARNKLEQKSPEVENSWGH